MDKTTWQARIRARVKASSEYLRTLAPGMSYGALSAATLLPLLTAVQQGEFGVLVELTKMVGSVGGALIANQIQQWHERSEADLAAELQALATGQPEWREALDNLVVELETPRIVQAVLGEAEWDRLEGLLRQELARLGNLARYEVILTEIHSGGGAVFQQGVEIGGDLVNRDKTIFGDEVRGDKYVHNYPPPLDPIAKAATEARERYLRRLHDRCNLLPLASLGGDESASDQVTLAQVYISLNTQTAKPQGDEPKAQSTRERFGRDDDEQPLTAYDVAQLAPRLVLLGDPGGGKSTFVRLLCTRLINHLLGRTEPPLAAWEQGLLPIYTELRELPAYVAGVDLRSGGQQEQAERLVQALLGYWCEKLDLMNASPFADALLQALERGRLLLVFDGLDEVPVDQRDRVRRTIHALTQFYPRIARVIVTCRVRSYTETLRLTGYQEHRLAPFTKEQIGAFCRVWYEAQIGHARFTQARAAERAADLERAALADNLAEMASNPMLLTTMAIVHQNEIGLPEQRVKLYSLAVEVLMERWQSHRGLALPAVLVDLLNDRLRLRKVLERLAYEAHCQRGQEEPDLPRGQLLIILEEQEYLDDVAVARDFLDYVDYRAGLLVGRGGEGTAGHPQYYAFPHRTFQEYLAGCHLLRGRRRVVNFQQKAAEGDTWALAARLGAEELLYNNPQSGETDLLDLVYGLCPTSEPEREQDWRTLVWSATMTADLLGRGTVAADEEMADGGQRYLARLVSRLVRLVQEERLLAVERAEGGRALGKLGDPRPGVGVQVCNDIRLPDIDWVPIAAGPFLMGSKREDTVWEDETPQLTCKLITEPYRISKYPITVAQYACFVAAGGYRQPAYWTDSGWAWVQENRIEGPEDYRAIFQTPNHPQVGASWHEVVAYCGWLSKSVGAEIRLPSEIEWARAGRFTDGRAYPWGNEFASERCNMIQTGIKATSAVGIFPSGASQEGVSDLSGNVLEWCSTKWGEKYQAYEEKVGNDLVEDETGVVRGGAWNLNEDFVRCSYWAKVYPANRRDLIGFRVVAPGL